MLVEVVEVAAAADEVDTMAEDVGTLLPQESVEVEVVDGEVFDFCRLVEELLLDVDVLCAAPSVGLGVHHVFVQLVEDD